MQLKFVSFYVEDKERALQVYTNVLGFTKMADIMIGSYRWLTVTSPDGIEGVELVLQPVDFEPARVYQKALFEAEIPAIALATKDITAEVARLKSHGVKFRSDPKQMGPIIAATFEDGCGNLINLAQLIV